MPSLPTADSSADPWVHLRRRTAARIALGRAGGSLPTREVLSFAFSHAMARDAVWAPFDSEGLAARLSPIADTVLLESAAADRTEYVARPDLGRRLSTRSVERLRALRMEGPQPKVVVLVCDGLSSLAAERNVPVLLPDLIRRLRRRFITIGPVCIVRHARVAIQDEVGELLGADLALSLLGERPGLGVPDSLGAYFVHGPRRGRTDADRNCVSNIRTGGLEPSHAARKLEALISESLGRGLSGLTLKECERTVTMD